MFWSGLLLLLAGTASASNFSYPRILIVGPSGVGKSSVGNVLAGCEPRDSECFFPICSGSDSCTKNTTIAEATYLGNLTGENAAFLDGSVTLVDSPGFGDTDGEDPQLIAEMINVLKNSLGEANTLLLCFEQGRWNPTIFKMIEELESLFGRDRLWNNVLIEVTKWAYDDKSIKMREINGITEEGTLADINQQLQKNFHLNHSLPGVFIDSFAVYFFDDEDLQKEYFLNYTRTLWEVANAMEPFEFYTIEDILDQLHVCQKTNDCLDQILKDKITKIETVICELESNVTDLVVNDKNLSGRIDTNIDNIVELTSNVTDLVVNDENLSGLIKSNLNHIKTNTDDIIELASNVTDLASTDQNLIVRIDDLDVNLNGRINHFDERLNDNTFKIVENKLQIQTDRKQTDKNTNDIDTNKDNIETSKDNIDTANHDISTNTETITALTNLRISYCGVQDHMYTTETITYSSLLTNINSLPTGDSLDIDTGVFTAPTGGTYSVSINYYTVGTGYFYVYPYINGRQMTQLSIASYMTDVNDRDMAGRTFTVQLDTRDTIDARIIRLDGDYIYKITFCVTFTK